MLKKTLTIFTLLLAVSTQAENTDANRDYQRAADLLKSGLEDQALISFGDFLRRYPVSQQADEAQYFMGEIYFRKKQYYEALKEFRKTQVRKQVDNETLAQATLKAGECWRYMGNPTFARIEWEAVMRKFPDNKLALTAKDLLGSLNREKQ